MIFIKFDINNDGVLTLEEFTELVRSLEPKKGETDVVQLFRKALEFEVNEENLDVMSPSAFCEMALEVNLGGYGITNFEEIVLIEELIAQDQENMQEGSKTMSPGRRRRIDRMRTIR